MMRDKTKVIFILLYVMHFISCTTTSQPDVAVEFKDVEDESTIEISEMIALSITDKSTIKKKAITKSNEADSFSSDLPDEEQKEEEDQKTENEVDSLAKIRKKVSDPTIGHNINIRQYDEYDEENKSMVEKR